MENECRITNQDEGFSMNFDGMDSPVNASSMAVFWSDPSCRAIFYLYKCFGYGRRVGKRQPGYIDAIDDD